MELSKLSSEIDVINAFHVEDMDITGISFHHLKIEEGYLFVCIKGYQSDGHVYLQSAVNNGAVAAIVQEYQPGINIPQLVVVNSRIAMARLAAAFYGHPSQHMKMIGITATNGKTTTSFMLNDILETAGLKTGLIGTVSVKIDKTYTPSELTTPESLDLQRFLKQMVDQHVTHGNYGGLLGGHGNAPCRRRGL